MACMSPLSIFTRWLMTWFSLLSLFAKWLYHHHDWLACLPCLNFPITNMTDSLFPLSLLRTWLISLSFRLYHKQKTYKLVSLVLITNLTDSLSPLSLLSTWLISLYRLSLLLTCLISLSPFSLFLIWLISLSPLSIFLTCLISLSIFQIWLNACHPPSLFNNMTGRLPLSPLQTWPIAYIYFQRDWLFAWFPCRQSSINKLGLLMLYCWDSLTQAENTSDDGLVNLHCLYVFLFLLFVS